ncbi:precorrin-6A synthase (deacetylating) [Ancylobacter oerskovii]|uniref:Precorrin-6A synthase [deacetylating] n=1 Tax=Ancylobacter oerskovii TaxID=459519 RepID=A0ABW4YUM5_9HYPH|nr:precorrin-6A synthase (deacetylating) [Ancylobacter oerskovii]MBS7544632.1 precorrin-6A synthase (deacetylating) [Ancylobacter oerskovii]
MTRRVLVIGIGMGDPASLTLKAVEAINRAEVFLFLDKGEAAAELIHLREAILRTHRRAPWRSLSLPSPKRGQEGRETSGGYRAGVEAWHAARAELLARAIAEEVPEDGTGALLVWGDPMLYDSTLRVLAAAASAGVDFEVEVIPGITAIQALCAAHRIPLNGIGENVEVTTGRRVAGATPAAPAFVVLLDDGAGLRALMQRGWDGQVWWGAYLGTPDEVLRVGRLAEVGEEILRVRAEMRARKGWVMDVWLGRGAGPAGGQMP